VLFGMYTALAQTLRESPARQRQILLAGWPREESSKNVQTRSGRRKLIRGVEDHHDEVSGHAGLRNVNDSGRELVKPNEDCRPAGLGEDVLPSGRR
jgi:hypothetical protein